MTSYTISSLEPAQIDEVPGAEDGAPGVDRSGDGGLDGVGVVEISQSLPAPTAFTIERDGSLAATVTSAYGPDRDGQTGPIRVVGESAQVQSAVNIPVARIASPIVLAPITSQAPLDIPIPINVALPYSLAIEGASGVSGASLGYDIDYFVGAGGISYRNADLIDTPTKGNIRALGFAHQVPLTEAFVALEAEGVPGAITAPFERFEEPRLIDGNLFIGIQSNYSINFRVGVETPQLAIDDTFMVEVDGIMVPANEVYVLAGPTNLGFFGDFPDIVSDAVDGFDFEPGNVLDTADRTITARGVDEDGFEAGFQIFGLTEEEAPEASPFRDVIVAIPEGASVIQSQLRPESTSFFLDEQPAIAIAGSGVALRNAGRIETGFTYGVGVLMVDAADGDANRIVNGGEIETTGALAPGILLGGVGAELTNRGEILTRGDESYGAWIVGRDLDVEIVAGSEIITEGENAIGLKVGNLDDIPSIIGVVSPSIGALETAAVEALELDLEDAGAFLAPATGIVRNAGLIETRAAFGAAEDEDTPPNVQPALFAVMEGGAVENSGTLRAEDYTVVLAGDATLRNSGLIEALDLEGDGPANALLLDGPGAFTVENSGVIRGDVTFVTIGGALTNNGAITGELRVGDGISLGFETVRDFTLNVGFDGVLGSDPEQDHSIVLVGDSGALGALTMTSNGAVKGGINALARGATIVLGEDSTIETRNDVALSTIGTVGVALAGAISVTGGDGIVVAPGELFGGTSTLDLGIGETGSIAVTGGTAVQAGIEGAATIVNEGTISAEGAGARGVFTFGVETRDGSIDNRGTISASGASAVAVVTLDANATNTGLIEAEGPNARAVVQGFGRVVNAEGGTLRAADGALTAIIADPDPLGFTLPDGSFNGLDFVNAGRVVAEDGAEAVYGQLPDDRVVNAGAIIGDIVLRGGSDTLVWRAGATLEGAASGGEDDDELVAEGGVIDGSVFLDFERFIVRGDVRLDGFLGIDSAAIEDGATLALDGVIDGDATVENGGVLVGEGVIVGDLTVEEFGTVGPGFSPGALTVEGDLVVSGGLEIEVNGVGPGEFDSITVGGTLDLSAATVRIVLGDGVEIGNLAGLGFLSAGAVTGLDGATVEIDGPADPGPASLELDPDGDVSVTVTAENEAPVAADDAFTLTEDDGATTLGNLLDNDADDAPGLTVVGLRDGAGAPLALGADNALSSGVLNVREEGTVTFTPDAGLQALSGIEPTPFRDVFTYVVEDAGGQTDTAGFSITVEGLNDAPSITSAAAFEVVENAKAVGAVTAEDPDGGALIFEILGGADADLFEINGATGALSFKTAPDHEAPGDEDADNVYELAVAVSDGRGGVAERDLTITVTDLDEGLPRIAGTEGNDRLTGTDAAELIDPLGGRTDVLTGLGGGDVFDFSSSTSNGARETRVIRDFDASEGDLIELGDAGVALARAIGDRMVLYLDHDRDLILLDGVSHWDADYLA